MADSLRKRYRDVSDLTYEPAENEWRVEIEEPLTCSLYVTKEKAKDLFHYKGKSYCNMSFRYWLEPDEEAFVKRFVNKSEFDFGVMGLNTRCGDTKDMTSSDIGTVCDHGEISQLGDDIHTQKWVLEQFIDQHLEVARDIKQSIKDMNIEIL